jgi:hypothetical protein
LAPTGRQWSAIVPRHEFTARAYVARALGGLRTQLVQPFAGKRVVRVAQGIAQIGKGDGLPRPERQGTLGAGLRLLPLLQPEVGLAEADSCRRRTKLRGPFFGRCGAGLEERLRTRNSRIRGQRHDKRRDPSKIAAGGI